MGKKRIITKTEEGGAAAGGSAAAKTAKKPQAIIDVGRFYIKSSYNNTMITATDQSGNVLAFSSAGALGFRGPKKSTPYAANKVAEALLVKISRVNFNKIEIFVRGIGAGRESAIRYLANRGLNIVSIKDMTPIPHNGPKPKKPRRL